MAADSIDLVRALAELEENDSLHEARLVLLLGAFAGPVGGGAVEGLTKLAKLDFLLRYPALLERALKVKGTSAAKVRVQEYERDSVESRMVRYRFGPWDHRYRRFVNLLAAKGLVSVHVDGRTVNIELTETGRAAAAKLSADSQNADMVRRAALLKSSFDIKATALKNFVYETFPELASLRMNEAIEP